MSGSLGLHVWRRLGLAARRPTAAPHPTAADVREALPAHIFNGYFKFAFVRNPWDWQVSWYHYVHQNRSHPLHPFVARMSGFEEFLTWRAENDRLLQKDFVADPQGGLLIDFLGRFEDLEEDFGKVCSATGVRAGLPHRNRSQHGDYRSCYTDRTRELVETHWAEDVRLFQYAFDPASNRASPGAAIRLGLA